jgi:hypothetical protein
MLPAMLYHLNLDGLEGSWWEAYVPELPGCFVSAPERQTVHSTAPDAIAAHLGWLRWHGQTMGYGSIETAIVETHNAWLSEGGYEVSAFFAADRPPLTEAETDAAGRHFAWSRQDLQAALDGLSPEQMAREVEDGWSLQTIVEHVATSERFYLDRLGLAPPRSLVPEDPFVLLAGMRALFLDLLPSLAGDDRLAVQRYEVWSPRKLLRRALCHERDHTQHALRFRAALD